MTTKGLGGMMVVAALVAAMATAYVADTPVHAQIGARTLEGITIRPNGVYVLDQVRAFTYEPDEDVPPMTPEQMAKKRAEPPKYEPSRIVIGSEIPDAVQLCREQKSGAVVCKTVAQAFQ